MKKKSNVIKYENMPDTSIIPETFYSSFEKISHVIAISTGHPLALILACLSIVIWGIFGPLSHYSDTWQLVINTMTSLLTFLMVFLIQNTQNRESKAIQLKLDELIRVSKANNKLLDSENLSDDDLEKLEEYYKKLCKKNTDLKV